MIFYYYLHRSLRWFAMFKKFLGQTAIIISDLCKHNKDYVIYFC